MAYFVYDASYNGRSCATNLSGEVIQAIEQAKKSGKLDLRDSTHPEFKASYRFFLDETNFVRLGVQSSPGKSADTEQVQFQFCGPESVNLRAKSDLLEKIVGLELK